MRVRQRPVNTHISGCEEERDENRELSEHGQKHLGEVNLVRLEQRADLLRDEHHLLHGRILYLRVRLHLPGGRERLIVDRFIEKTRRRAQTKPTSEKSLGTKKVGKKNVHGGTRVCDIITETAAANGER